MKQDIKQKLTEGIEAHYANKFDQAEISYKKVIELMPNLVEAHYNLANLFNTLGRLDEAEVSYKKAIEFNPKLVEAHINRGNIFKKLGRLDEAEASYKKAIEFNPKLVEAHNNRGNALKDLGRYDEAIVCYKKAIILNPNLIEPRYNLGILLYNKKKYLEALEHFKLINFKEGKNYLLRCLYSANQQPDFYKQLDTMLNQGETNAVIGSLISRSEIKYGINRLNPFCNEPLKYVLISDLSKKYDFKNIFIKTANDILKDKTTGSKAQGHLTNGRQTSGNFFDIKGFYIKQIENIIHLELEKYRIHFKNSNEGFLKKWPASYKINGWLVNMKSGGSIKAHMHDLGWITGSIYINVPRKVKNDSGNIVVCLDDTENKLRKTKQESTINVLTGSLCLFPASLLHYTIPFESQEDRTVLAFDVIPNN